MGGAGELGIPTGWGAGESVTDQPSRSPGVNEPEKWAKVLECDRGSRAGRGVHGGPGVAAGQRTSSQKELLERVEGWLPGAGGGEGHREISQRVRSLIIQEE